jgi:hypothetical protein
MAMAKLAATNDLPSTGAGLVTRMVRRRLSMLKRRMLVTHESFAAMTRPGARIGLPVSQTVNYPERTHPRLWLILGCPDGASNTR